MSSLKLPRSLAALMWWVLYAAFLGVGIVGIIYGMLTSNSAEISFDLVPLTIGIAGVGMLVAAQVVRRNVRRTAAPRIP